MSPRQRYAPPAINQDLLCSSLVSVYPSHTTTRNLMQLLVFEYMKLWRMKLGYPEKRIVASPCIVAVQCVHQTADREMYFSDCMAYFRRYIPFQEWGWTGIGDIRGTLDTLHAYNDLFQEPLSDPWKEIENAHALKKNSFRLVAH
jgi:hypothetical protein